MDDTTWERIRYVCKPRAIRRKVADGVITPYEKGSPEPRASGLFDDIDDAQWASTFKRLIDGSEGILIRKHPVNDDPIFPQLRPKDRVEVWPPDVHDHDGLEHVAGAGCICGARWHHYGWKDDAYTKHERAAHEAGKRHRYAVERVDGMHAHPRDPRYMLAPSPKKWVTKEHTHTNRTHPGHMHKDHDGRPWWEVPEPHPIVRRKKDRSVKRELRLDLNPTAARELDASPVVYFSIEGTLKALAITSAGAPAFAVPSVTMWPAPELRDFARRLRGKTVVVVPDSDWRSNPMVALQAFTCAEYIDDISGVSAIVAAATNSSSRAPCDHGTPRRDCDEHRKRGVDDFLKDRHSLDDLVVVDRELPPAFAAWRDRIMRARSLGEIRARERLVDVVEWIARHANDAGEVARPGKTLAKHMRMSVDRIRACVEQVEDLPEPDPRDSRMWSPDPATASEPWDAYRPFTVSTREADRSRYAEGDWFYRVFTLRPDLRAEDRPRRLGEVLNARSSPTPQRDVAAG